VIDAWRHWKSLIIKVAKLEDKRISIKKLLERYEATDGVTCENGIRFDFRYVSVNYNCCIIKTDYKDYIAMEILLKLLYPRNTKGVFYQQVIVSTCVCSTTKHIHVLTCHGRRMMWNWISTTPPS